jgi:hypothetical protein
MVDLSTYEITIPGSHKVVTAAKANDAEFDLWAKSIVTIHEQDEESYDDIIGWTLEERHDFIEWAISNELL